MNVMTSHSVVDRMAADLAERRRNTICRNRAYINLARAILGIYAILGTQAAAIGGAIVLAIFTIGAAIYGLLALVGHFADNARREKND